MKENDIKAAIIEILTNNLNDVSKDEIKDELLLEDIGLDSLTYIRIIVQIEEQFSIELDDEILDIHMNPTVGELLNNISKIIISKGKA